MEDIHVTLVYDRFDLRRLPEEQRAIARKLFRKFRQNPDWNDFANYYQKICRPVFDQIPRKRVPETPLYLIAQDLEMRLGIRQGKTRKPDYRDMLEYLIRREYSSIAAFCKESGEDQAYLSHLFSMGRSASVERLRRILDKLGYELSFTRKQETLNV